MKIKYLVMSIALMLGVGQACRPASFQNIDKSAFEGGSGDGDSIGGTDDSNPDLDPTGNPVDNGGSGTGTGDSGGKKPDGTGTGKGTDPVDPVDGGKGKMSLMVTLPMPSIKMGENKMQATARLNTTTTPPNVRWSVSGPMDQMSIGTIDEKGVYTSPKVIDKPFPVSIIATLISDPTIKGMAPLLVEPLTDMNPMKPILTVTTPVDTVKTGENKVPATAIINTSMTPPPVNWSIIPPTGIMDPGSIDSSGVYTSPKGGTMSFPVTIVATLKTDPSVTGIKTIRVDPGMKPILTVTVPSPEIKAGGEKMQATPKLSTQTTPPEVTWSITGPMGRPDIGSIDSSGVYTSPNMTDVDFPVVIIATLKSDPTITGQTSIRVIPKEVIFARCTRGNEVFPILAEVYEINSTAQKIPNFGNPTEARKKTQVCMDRYAVAPRNFDTGFPDLGNSFIEWFALKTTTKLVITQGGLYTFYLNSDDGSKLSIGKKETVLIDNDGHHQALGTSPEDSQVSGQKEASIFLNPGEYDLFLDYFQGPRYRMALELKWKVPGSSSVVYVPRTAFK